MSCFSPSRLITFLLFPVSFLESFYHNFESVETVSLDLLKISFHSAAFSLPIPPITTTGILNFSPGRLPAYSSPFNVSNHFPTQKSAGNCFPTPVLADRSRGQVLSLFQLVQFPRNRCHGNIHFLPELHWQVFSVLSIYYSQ